MQSQFRGLGLSRPVSVSLSSASAEFNYWLKENTRKYLMDRSGQRWEVQVHVVTVPHPERWHGSQHKIHLGFRTFLTAESLQRTGVLNAARDHRLIDMLGEATIPITVRSTVRFCDKEEEIPSVFREEFEEMRSLFAKGDFVTQKRRCVGHWVDQKCLFGARGEE